MIIHVHLDKKTQKRLHVIAQKDGRTVEDLAEIAVENTAAEYFRHRKDDPAKEG